MDLLAEYRARGPGHDEMLQAAGPARAAWADLARQAHLGSAERLAAARAEVLSLLEDQGVTYGEEGWALDPLPVLVEEAEWGALERGLRQRAELLDRILDDLYGERTLLTSGLLPPEIVLAHPGFVRAAHGVRLRGAHQLFHTATDLARNADGAWTVLADRADVPLGLGYAMAGRRVVSEVFAGPYRQSRTRRLGPFYRALRQALSAVAPPGAGDDPRVAVLTPGASGTAFDHGYLSAMLGVPLAQGGDLEVADGRVWLRAPGRREPVDVLLRAVPSARSDPLDLDPDSTAGTAGLLEAARRGALSIVNTIGSGLLESPALATYLPRLARALRDEDLLLPSVVSYWCGERSMCSHVIANLGRLVLRSVTGGRPPVLGWELSLDGRADLAAEIAARPWAWVGQEPVEASTTPGVVDGALTPLPTSLRTFALAHEGDYTVLPGALGHTGTTPQATLARTDLPGAAKDVWVLAAEPLATGTTEPREAAAPERAGSGTVTLHSAGDLHRLGRHLERAETTVRLLLAAADRWDDHHARPGAPPQDPGGRALGVLLAALPGPEGHGLPALVTDAATEGSVAWTVAQLGRDAAGVRDNLTPEVWVALSAMDRVLRRERERRRGRDPAAERGLAPTLLGLLQSLLALHGIVSESLVRDAGWALLDAGRRLERARGLVATLGATVTTARDPAVERLVLDSVLSAHESAITFRRRYPAGGLGGALELLLRDPRNPRSLAFQLERLREDLADLPPARPPVPDPAAALTEVTGLLAAGSLDTAADDGGRRGPLARTLAAVEGGLTALGAAVHAAHLAHPAPARWTAGGWGG